MLTQCDQSPNGRPDLGLTFHPINLGIAAIPAALWTHPIVQHRFCEFAPVLRVGPGCPLNLLNDQRIASRFNPTGGARSPAPPAKRNRLFVDPFAIDYPTRELPPETGISRPIVIQPNQ